MRTCSLLPPYSPLPSYCNSDSIHKAQSLLLPAKNCLLKRNWRFGMTVILASLAMDLWHGLFLPRRMNASCTVCCMLLPSPCQQRDNEKRNMGFGPGTNANTHCLQNLGERCLIHRKRQWPSGTLYCSFSLSPVSRGPQLRACPPVGVVFLIFRGGGFDQNPACIFPEIQVFFKIICFSLEGSWNKMVFMGSWGNFGCLYQMGIKPLRAHSLASLRTTNHPIVC